MSEFGAEKRVVISPDPTALAESVANRLLHRLLKRTRAGIVEHIAVTGGDIALAVLAAAGASPVREKVDWSLVHVWWGNERFVAADSPERNEWQTRRALLDHIAVPAENIHAVAAADSGLDLDAAADAYAQELALFAADGNPWPHFDICLLGVGSDAHIASLFPDRAEITVTDRSVLPVRESPKPPPERVTLTRPVINSAARVWLVLAGSDKASALGLALAGASYTNVPAGGAKGTKRTIFFVDAAAAERVPAELIDQEYY
ncbi:6-phosphogluconolactonase [Microbacterium fluvii]|uniref:6-phosphogluconolactonase n=1 Tax=Microbacterium fluvii TaxID=415215 RepID=A0ABW2HCK6_9MICO|nr:6-phosphogluconolactonase [Microbacterium fluvii]MCU4672627.1 6-phosphogluconolactonase [Microbacterium fluvii]